MYFVRGIPEVAVGERILGSMASISGRTEAEGSGATEDALGLHTTGL